MVSRTQDISDGVACAGRFRVAMHDVADIRAADPYFSERAPESKLRVLDTVEPVQTGQHRNVTCVGLHEWMAESLNAATAGPPELDGLALGRSATQPAVSDTALNDHVATVGITAFEPEGTQVRITVFVGEGEANVDTDAGETLSEAGFVADGRLLNHALFDTEYEKDATKTLSVEGVLSFTNL